MVEASGVSIPTVAKASVPAREAAPRELTWSIPAVSAPVLFRQSGISGTLAVLVGMVLLHVVSCLRFKHFQTLSVVLFSRGYGTIGGWDMPQGQAAS